MRGFGKASKNVNAGRPGIDAWGSDGVRSCPPAVPFPTATLTPRCYANPPGDLPNLPAPESPLDKPIFMRWFLALVGLLALVLGAVGVFLPLLPTTPFLLLAAGCFMRSSDRLYLWLIRQRWVGGYIRNYREHGAMALRAKAVALALLWAGIGYSAAMVADSWWLRAFLLCVAVGVTLHILHLRAAPRDSAGPSRGEDESASEDARWPKMRGRLAACSGRACRPLDKENPCLWP